VGALRLSGINWGVDLSPATRVSNALVSYVRYLKLIVWPQDQAILYPYPSSIPLWQAVGAALLLAAITAAAIWFGRRRPYLAVGWLWFAIGLGPVIGLVKVGRQSMADRFTYIPVIGLLLAAIWGLAEVLSARQRVTAAVAAVVLYGEAEWRYTRSWRDSVTVFTQAVAATRNNSAAHHYLAAALEERGRFDEACRIGRKLCESSRRMRWRNAPTGWRSNGGGRSRRRRNILRRRSDIFRTMRRRIITWA
jgi:hypothetical protein